VAEQDYRYIDDVFDRAYRDSHPSKIPAGRVEIALNPGERLQTFELDLARAEGFAHLAGGARVEALFSAGQPVALIRVPGPAPRSARLLTPGMVAAAGTLFHGERVTRARIAALALAIGGMALVVLSQLDAAQSVRVDLIGIVLALLAAVCQVIYFTVGRSGFRHVPSDEATLVVFLISLPIYAAVATVAGGLGAAIASPLADPALLAITLVIGVLGAATPSVFVLIAIRRIGGTRTGILLMLEPVGGVVLAALLLGQALQPIQVVGGALVIAGGILLQVVPEREGGEVIVAEDEPAPTF
jgi:uncharacterized membrane protein